ncbi:MAG: hypothetical protein ACYDBV_15105 [Nitrospiria bacterium]
MFLYHGTSNTAFLNNIKEDGLKPRKKTLSNFYTQNVQSNSEVVYLNNDRKESCPFYCFRSCLLNQDEKGVIITIDTDKLDESKFRVDENFLDIEERGSSVNCPIDLRDKQQKKLLKDNRWKESLEKTAKASYRGKINPEAFTMIEEYDIKKSGIFDQEMFDIEDKELRLRASDSWLEGDGYVGTYIQNGGDLELNVRSYLWNFLPEIFRYHWMVKGGESLIYRTKHYRKTGEIL